MGLRFLSLVVSLLSLLCVLVNSSALDCASACEIPLTSVLFNGSSPDDTYYTGLCTNYLRVQSIYMCAKTYCTDREIKAGLKDLTHTCEAYGLIEPLSWSIVSNISVQDAQSWPHIGLDYLESTTTYDTPVFVSSELYDLAYRTSATWNQSVTTRADYGYALFGFFAGVFLIAMIARMVNSIVDQRSTADHKPSSFRLLSLATKRYIITPALFSHHVAEPVGWCTVPQRLQAATIGAFIIINVVLCAVSYDLFTGNIYWPNTRTQLWRYFSDRTGVLAIANLPLMFAFSMRNNILIWLTGWDYATFNMFHRWVARIATIEAVLHSIGYTVECFLDGGKAEYVEEFAEQYWWMGVIATVAMSFLCVFSIYPIRKLFYEVFLLLHIALAVLFLIGMWYHVEIFEGEYNGYIWPCVAVWAFDRVLRVSRLCHLNFPSFSATATYSAEADIVRITVPVRSGFKPQPGTHYYLYGFNSLKFWESHPFTLSSWTSKSDNAGQQSLTFLVRPHDSFTKRLRNTLQQKPGAEPTTKARLALEGPYGHAHTLTHFHSLLFIIGGSGITVALSHLQALYETIQTQPLPLRNIHLVWAIRDLAVYHSIHHHELSRWLTSSGLANKIEIRIDVHVTRSDVIEGKLSPDDSSETSSPVTSTLKPVVDVATNEKDATTTPPTQVTIVKHRPAINETVLSAAETWCVRGERLGVICCGPAGMADDTRAAVVDAYARGHEGVDFKCEAFGW